MSSKKKIDMTQGPIMKLVVLFAIPICLGNILQQLYNTVDTLVIGNFCDSVALAAVGTSAQPVEFILCLFMGMGTGVSILVSQYTGSNELDKVKDVIATSISFVYMCSIPLAILGFFIGPLVLKIMQVPEDAFPYATSYVRIIFFGTIGNMGYNYNAGILRGLGDSKASLLFLAISCIVNIVLDLLFVAVFHWDVTGVALATTIAMLCSWIFSVYYIKRRYPELEFTILPKRVDKALLKDVVGVGLPLGLNNSIYSIGHILVQSLINMQGSTFIAACSVGSRLPNIANVAIGSFSSAASTFSGQNFGAKNYRRLKKGGYTIPLFSGLVTCTAGLTLTFFCEPVLRLFTQDPAVLELAVLYIRILLPFTWCYAIFNGIINFVNGMGRVRYTTIVNILMLWMVRIPSAYIIAHYINGNYVTAAIPISFVFGMTCMLCYYLTPKWREICRLAKNSN